MATYIDNTAVPSETKETSGFWFVIGLITLIVVFSLFIFYGMPALRSNSGTPQINVPEKIDVNVNNPQGGGGNANPQPPAANP